MPNNSLDIFVSHLEELLLDCGTYKNLSELLNLPESSLKCWILHKRTPKLSTLDIIASKLNCTTSDLLNPATLNRNGTNTNSSRDNFVKNLNICFVNRGCYSIPQKLYLIDNVINDFTLISYFRVQNYRTPTLEKLDAIADALNIQSYELLMEV